MVFLAGTPPFETREATLRRLKQWLDGHGYVEYARFEPDDDSPRRVIASVWTDRLFGVDYPVDVATLEVQWQTRRDAKDHFWITWAECPDEYAETKGLRTDDPTLPSGYTLTAGLHQDDTHPDLGPAHFQHERPGVAEREGINLVGNSPLAILDYFLGVLPEHVAMLRDEVTQS